MVIQSHDAMVERYSHLRESGDFVILVDHESEGNEYTVSVEEGSCLFIMGSRDGVRSAVSTLFPSIEVSDGYLIDNSRQSGELARWISATYKCTVQIACDSGPSEGCPPKVEIDTAAELGKILDGLMRIARYHGVTMEDMIRSIG